MKKTLVSALTVALVAGAASTTFAAANPFADVPSDHWAYDAVAQLAKDGVIDGYGDSTYRGDNQITRYEMAQLVARAMAKQEAANAADKAMIDKLAAEFSDELNSLGVRVAALEKNADKVKWNGEAFWKFYSVRKDSDGAEGRSANTNRFVFRLDPSAQVNEHWTANARMEYRTSTNDAKNLDSSQGGSSDNQLRVARMWAQGQYGNTTINLGKMPFFSNVDQGMVVDDVISGAQVVFGKQLKTTITVGRYNGDNEGYFDAFDDSHYNTTSLQSVEFAYDNGGKLTGGAAYYHLNGVAKNAVMDNKVYNTDKVSLWELGLGYKFNKNTALNGSYAQNTQGDFDSKHRRAYSIEFDYKAADPAKKGSFGLFAAYRHLGAAAVIAPTYDAMFSGVKGWDIGGSYVFDKNIVGTAKYFRGKEIEGDVNASAFYSSLEFLF